MDDEIMNYGCQALQPHQSAAIDSSVEGAVKPCVRKCEERREGRKTKE
jgi:hypothetical protein